MCLLQVTFIMFSVSIRFYILAPSPRNLFLCAAMIASNMPAQECANQVIHYKTILATYFIHIHHHLVINLSIFPINLCNMLSLVAIAGLSLQVLCPEILSSGRLSSVLL